MSNPKVFLKIEAYSITALQKLTLLTTYVDRLRKNVELDKKNAGKKMESYLHHGLGKSSKKVKEKHENEKKHKKEDGGDAQ